MDRLSRTSSGVCETSSGALGIVPLKVTRISGDLAWFQFKGHSFGPTIRVEWHTGISIAVLDREIAAFMLAQRYARNPTDAELDEYNGMVADAPAPAKPVPEPPPAPATEPEPAPAPAEPDKQRRGRPSGKKND